VKSVDEWNVYGAADSNHGGIYSGLCMYLFDFKRVALLIPSPLKKKEITVLIL
jgi:hypothetical protein